MQTDVWLTGPNDPVTCPLCSKPLVERICYSCGFQVEPTPKPNARPSVWIDPHAGRHNFTDLYSPEEPAERQRQHTARPVQKQPNPVTPIPQRASAPPSGFGTVQVRPKYRRTHTVSENSDVTRMPTLQQTNMWQYESPKFEAESSLSALSLVIPEAPTRPETPSSSVSEAPTRPHVLQGISELPTRPGSSSLPISEAPTRPDLSPTPKARVTVRLSSIHEEDTTPPTYEPPTRALVPIASQGVELASASWTSGGAKNSAYAQRIAEHAKRTKPRRSTVFHPLDNLRWWLLAPGRLEFLFWLAGTVLLISVTCILLLVTAFSFAWISPGQQIATGPAHTPMASGQGKPAGRPAQHLNLKQLDGNSLAAGQNLHLQGQGFTANGSITFAHDANQPLSDTNGFGSIHANSHGEFTDTFFMDYSWNTGEHVIIARDVATNHQVSVSIVLVPEPISTQGTSTATPGASGSTPTPSPTATPTPVGGSTGGNPTPVSQTPVPVSPTPGTTPSPSPTPIPATPTPKPTAGITPTPTARVTPTATPRVTPTATPRATPTAKATAAPKGATLGNALNNDSTEASDQQKAGWTHFDPWLWVVVFCYALAMILLGVAGLLHKRRQSSREA